MDLDNIKDIEVLRAEIKKNMIKVKKGFYAKDGTMYKFKKDHWYYVDQDEYYITVFSTDGQSYCTFTYGDAKDYLYDV